MHKTLFSFSFLFRHNHSLHFPENLHTIQLYNVEIWRNGWGFYRIFLRIILVSQQYLT